MNYFSPQILLLSVSLTEANGRKTRSQEGWSYSRSWLLRAEVRGRATHPEWLHGEPPLTFLTKSIQLKYTYCPLGHISSAVSHCTPTHQHHCFSGCSIRAPRLFQPILCNLLHFCEPTCILQPHLSISLFSFFEVQLHSLIKSLFFFFIKITFFF